MHGLKGLSFFDEEEPRSRGGGWTGDTSSESPRDVLVHGFLLLACQRVETALWRRGTWKEVYGAIISMRRKRCGISLIEKQLEIVVFCRFVRRSQSRRPRER